MKVYVIGEPLMATVKELRSNLNDDLAGRDYGEPFLEMYDQMSHQQVVTLCDALELKGDGTATVEIDDNHEFQCPNPIYCLHSSGQSVLIQPDGQYEYDVEYHQ